MSSSRSMRFDACELNRFGITRVGDLTALDTIGIPVWFACRPNSRGLSVAQGKGTDNRRAQMSAVMEAIEGAVAERPREIVTEFGSYREVVARGASVVPLETMSRCDFESFDPWRERAWVRGRSVIGGEGVLAPYELVGLDMRSDFPWDREAFRMASQGLAAGLEFWPTALHALQELAEGDATAPLALLGSASGALRPIEFVTRGTELGATLAKVRAAGLEARLFAVEGGIDAPVIGAVIDWSVVAATGPLNISCAGFACRLDPEAAALAALLEAAQSRLTEISGARDDLSQDRLPSRPTAPWRPSGPVASCDEIAARRPMPPGASAESQFGSLVERIVASGANDVYLFSLGGAPRGVHVVRVLADGLQSSAPGFRTLGARGIAAFCGGRRE